MKNNLFEKILATSIMLVAVIACFASEPAKPAEDLKPDPVAEITKERDAAKADLTATQQQLAALQLQNQYLSVLAERNEMAVRLLQANARADELQKQLDTERAKVAELEKKIDTKK